MTDNKPIGREKLKELIECAKREVKMRYVVYPHRIASGKMTEAEAEKEKKQMYTIQLLLQKIYDGTAPEHVMTIAQGVLFDTAQYQPKWYEKWNI